MVRRVSVATATSIQSEYFNRKTSKADFERYSKLSYAHYQRS